MSFSGSISQCGGTGHAEEAFLAWWSSSGGEEGLGPACAAWSESERESDKEKWAGVKQRLSDCGCQLMKSGFWPVGVWGRETSLHLNASLEKHRTWRVLQLHHPPLFPNLLFPGLSGRVVALNFDERKPEILSFLNSLFTPLHLPSCLHSSSHAFKVFW